MSAARRKSSLFEAMSKTPQVDEPARRGGFSWWRRRRGGASSSLIVAEPLTEEEAAVELAAEQAEREKAAAPKKTKNEPRNPEAQHRADGGGADGAADRAPPFVRTDEGRLVVSLGTTSSLVVAAVLCVVVLGSYSVGRRSVGKQGGMSKAAAIRHEQRGTASPLLPAASDDQGRSKPKPVVNPDLSHLLSKPPARRESEFAANRPVDVQADAPGAAFSAERLNYLQIESFPITRLNSGDQVKRDLEDVRRFLAERGVQSFARRLGNGYVLFSEQGFPPGPEYAREREAFRAKMGMLGKEYRRAGGRYEFRGCLFVSHSKTRLGRPAERARS